MPPTKHFCNTTVACREKPAYATDVKFMIGWLYYILYSLHSIFQQIFLLYSVILAPFILLVIVGTIYDLIFVQPTLDMLPDQKYDLIKVNRANQVPTYLLDHILIDQRHF